MIDRLKVDLRVPTAMAIGAADILRFRHRLRPDGIHSLRYPALSEPTDKSPGPPWQVGFRDFMWGFSRCGHFLLRLAGIPPRWHPAFFSDLNAVVSHFSPIHCLAGWGVGRQTKRRTQEKS